MTDWQAVGNIRTLKILSDNILSSIGTQHTVPYLNTLAESPSIEKLALKCGVTEKWKLEYSFSQDRSDRIDISPLTVHSNHHSWLMCIRTVAILPAHRLQIN